jgi:orotidine-5'-phosphate decarboxylase
MGKDVIIACDFSSAQQTFDFLDKFTEEKPFVKIGMELFYAEGPSIVREIKKGDTRFFLTLSFTIFLIQLKNQWLFFQSLMLI